MSTFRTPVGPQPSSVYWRRRLVVGLGLLAVIVIILLIIFQPKGEPVTPPKATHTTSPTTSPTDAPATGKEQCAPGVIDVVAATDQNSYAPGENPKLTLTLTNRGAVACTFNAGTSQQEYLITSGDELYWNSKDCQAESSDTPVVLQPNKPATAPAITWDRTRSDPATCAGDRVAAPGGGASYHLNINVGDLKSNDVQFALE